MLFNSYEFIFAFLPATLLIYFLLGRISRNWGLGWLIVASVLFFPQMIGVPIVHFREIMP